MGQKLQVRPGAEIVVSIVVRDPADTNFSPYTFSQPFAGAGRYQSAAQCTGSRPHRHDPRPGERLQDSRAPDYSANGRGTRNWLRADGTTADLSAVPDAAKNTTAAVIKTFNGSGATPWSSVTSVDGGTFLKMTYRIPAVQTSQYVRLRGTNLPASVPFETDANGNPLADIYTNQNDTKMLSIPCTTTHSAASQFDAMPGSPRNRYQHGGISIHQPDRGSEGCFV